jgi:hypothetical protein
MQASNADWGWVEPYKSLGFCLAFARGVSEEGSRDEVIQHFPPGTETVSYRISPPRIRCLLHIPLAGAIYTCKEEPR